MTRLLDSYKAAGLVLVVACILLVGYRLEAGPAPDDALEAAAANPCLDEKRRSAYAVLQSCRGVDTKVSHDRLLLAKVLVKQADAYRDLGRYAAAQADYSRALDLAELARGMPSSWAEVNYPEWRAKVLTSRARTFIELNELASALDDLDASIALARQSESFQFRARVRLRLGLFSDAIDDADILRARRAESHEAVGQRGYYLFAAGRYAEALSAFRDASTLDPSVRDWVIWGYLSMLRVEKRAGRPSDLPPDVLHGWDSYVLRFLSGQLTVETFRDIAEKEDPRTNRYPMCEAELFIGQKLMLQGRMVAGMEVLRWLEQPGGKCAYSFFEFQIARHELARMQRQLQF